MKVGLLGGAFNPPHIGHLILANQALDNLGLNKVQFIPTRKPPHKDIANNVDPHLRSLFIKIASGTIEPLDLRLALVQRRVFNQRGSLNYFLTMYTTCYLHFHDERLEVNDIEVNNILPDRSFTISTVKAIREAHPAWELHLIIGQDQAEVFDTWKDWGRLSEIATICVAGRGDGKLASTLEKFPFMRTFDFTPIGVSSDDIRGRIRDNRSISHLLPPSLECLFDMKLFRELYL